jgi:glycosyltransferase involved in cell wall biosynthesis
MRLLLLAPGKSIHTHKWAMYFKEQGHEVLVATFKDHYLADYAKEINTVVLPKLLPGKLSYLISLFSLKKIIKSFKPDLLHAHYVSSYGLVGALTNFSPYYISVWGRDIFQFPQQNKVNEQLVTFTLSKADVICSTSHVMAKETSKYTNKPIKVTPFGVDLTIFQPMNQGENDEITIGTVKALSDKYGIADLIQAFSIVNKKYPSTKLLIVGDGPQRQEYEQLVKTLNIDEQTTFTGRVPNHQVPNYINKIDIFTVPSTEDSESFGVAAVEAMACGKPVIVSNVGGLPEVVIEGQTGIVIPKENPDQLAQEIVHLIKNKSVREDMGKNGVQHVKEHYDWLKNAQDMERLYKGTLS